MRPALPSRVYSSLSWKLFLVRYHLPISLKRRAWSMHIQDFECIFTLMKGKRNLTVLELGSGISTIIFASGLSRLSQNSSIVTLEAEERWMEAIQKMVVKYELTDYVRVHHVPYKQYAVYIWFDEQAIKEILGDKKIDILVVDAPPDTLCHYSRRPAMPFFLPYLKRESIVVLHDAKRPDEVQIVREWKYYFHECETIDTPLGLAVFKSPKGKQV